MTILSKSPSEVIDRFKIEYPFLNLDNNIQFHKMGKMLVVLSDVVTSPTLPIPEKVYHNFVIGMFPERRASERRV